MLENNPIIIYDITSFYIQISNNEIKIILIILIILI